MMWSCFVVGPRSLLPRRLIRQLTVENGKRLTNHHPVYVRNSPQCTRSTVSLFHSKPTTTSHRCFFSRSHSPLSHQLHSSPPSDKEVVYVAPLKGAVRAIKVFSLTTALASFFGGPILVWLGNLTVPLAGRVIMTSLVMLVGLGTTALLHWLVKGM